MALFVKGIDNTYLNMDFVSFFTVKLTAEHNYCIVCATNNREIILKENIESRQEAEKGLGSIMEFFAKRRYENVCMEQ